MFISRVEMPWDTTLNPYNFHRRLWRLFPDQSKETRSTFNENRHGFLFRVERIDIGQPIRFLVQSRSSPEQAPGLSLLGSREFRPKPRVDQKLAFILTANATKKIRDKQFSAKPGKKNDKCRVPLIKEEEQKAWMARKIKGIVVLENVSVIFHPPVFFQKGYRAGKLSIVTFEGILRVVNPEKLVALLRNGIGPAKAFGCGLMLVRRK